MQLTFLQAKVPLTKNYEKKPDGSYVSGSYPGITQFTSITETVDTPARFAEALEKHADLGSCLLTNSLKRQITNESRAKLSDKEELRKWLVLDLDGIENFTKVEDFISTCLPKQFQDASYIVQHSPSSGIKAGLRVHLFFMLYDEVDVGSVSAWLKYTNLATEQLRDQITLSKNSMALSFPLDWVANNNGRIIYITPPECKNFSDPVTDRIKLVQKKYDTVSFNFAAIGTSQMRAKYKERLNELRSEAGLPISRKTDFFILKNDKEYIIDSLVESARITDPVADNDRFMRCNLDGGDSYAYYYHRDHPTYLHNFKGEPSARLKLVDPEYYDKVAKPDMEALQAKSNRPFVFRDEASDKYFMGVRKEEEIIRQPAVVGSQQKIEDYFNQFGSTSPPAIIPTWDRIFDPTQEQQWDEDNLRFNTWRPTKYQQNAMYKSLIPLTISKLIAHVTGNCAETYWHFLNWLAYIYQNRTKSGTAWVLHGIPGTGKGLLYHNVIRPIFGDDYCQQKQIRDLKDKFNGWMEQALFVNIDEANTEDTYSEARATINSLKNWITESTMSIRHMQSTAVNRASYINFIFTTNDFGILPIQDGDRRFNVAPRQEKPIEISSEEVKEIKRELQDFAGFLAHYEVNKAKAHSPIENQAKESLKLAAESSIDTFFRALREGDLEYFLIGIEESTQEYESMSQLKIALDLWLDDVKHDRESVVTETQMKHAHIVLCREKSIKTSAFRSMCAKRGVPIKRCGTENRWRGWRIKWDLDDDLRREHKMHLHSVKSTAEQEAKIAEEINNEKSE